MQPGFTDRKSTRLNSSHQKISYAVFCLKKKERGCFSATPPNVTARRAPRGNAISGCHGMAGDQVQRIALMSGKFRRAMTYDLFKATARKGVPPSALHPSNFA